MIQITNVEGRKTWFLSHHYQVLIASRSLFEQMNMAISVPSELRKLTLHCLNHVFAWYEWGGEIIAHYLRRRTKK